MAYQQYPYLQAHPPPGYGAPGSTAYFTTQHLGGFYAPISSNTPFPQAQGATPMIGSIAGGGPPGITGPVGSIGSIGSSGQMFNRWPGAREEQEKQREQAREQAEADKAKSNKDEKTKKKKKNKNKNKNKATRPSTPWEQVVADIEKEEDEKDEDGSEGSSCSGFECEGTDKDEEEEEEDDDDDGDIEVVIQPGGSAQVVMYLNHRHQDRPPRRTTFVVSARRMRAEARGWLHMCHQDTDRYDTTVGDEAAVVGMYWLLLVLHTGVESGDGSAGRAPGSGYDHGNGNSNGDSNGEDEGTGGHRLRPGMAPSTTPRASTTLPTELPARVLAYTALFAKQFGVLDKGLQALPGGSNIDNNSYHGSPGSVIHTNTAVDRFRARAEVWLRAITAHPRHRDTLDSAAIASADWPFVLFTARVLTDRALFATCLRTLLDRWYVDERGVFCDAGGPVRLDLLPASMRETVLRDLASLKSARERSVDAIVNGAMNAFGYGASGRH
ncbi:MAG: hypothetical protein STHCBS139747_002695 [Sporothrix thermara]